MCLSASSSSEGLITYLLSSDGRCVAGTSRSLQIFVQSSNRNICMPVQTNSFERLSELLKLRTIHPGREQRTATTQETRPRSPGLIDFGPRNWHLRGWKRLGLARLFPHCSAPWLGASIGTWSRRWANVWSFVGESFIACARALLLVRRASTTAVYSTVVQCAKSLRLGFFCWEERSRTMHRAKMDGMHSHLNRWKGHSHHRAARGQRIPCCGSFVSGALRPSFAGGRVRT
jgi:hypothetical protein